MTRTPSVTLLLLAALATLGGCATTGAEKEAPDPAAEEVPLEQLLADADESLRNGDLDAAQVGFSLAVERDPKNVEALYRLGVIHREKGSLSVAEGLLRTALQVRPRHQGSREALGIVLLEQERLDEAEETLLGALEGRPDSWQVMNALGVVHDMRARHAEAQEMFTAALHAAPRSAKVSNNLGYSHYLAGDYDRAEKHIRDATRFDPEYGRAWSNLALVYARLGRYRDATAAFDRIVERHQSANNLGYLGLLEGDPKLARAQLERALRLSPSYYEVANQNLSALEGQADRRGADDAAPATDARSADLSDAPPAPLLLPDAMTTIVPALGPDPEPSPDAAPAPTRRASAARASSRRNASSRGDAASNAALPLRPTLAFVGFAAADDSDDALQGAVGRFQDAYGLEPDGRPGRRTRAKLREVAITQLQTKLVALGYDPGEADGALGRRTRTAIRAFEESESLPLTGQPNEAVMERIELAVGRASRQLNTDDRIDYSSRG